MKSFFVAILTFVCVATSHANTFAPICTLTALPVGCGGANDVTFSYTPAAGDAHGDCSPLTSCKVKGTLGIVVGGADTIVSGPTGNVSLVTPGGSASVGPLNLDISCGNKATWQQLTSGCKFEFKCGDACVN